ncbi:hypothetical protein ACI51W_01140 (plasmid) [Pseudomonas marginalis]|uniref:hypothetical protein n=1 Tax=Pseudomonas marginalis TaxID=298 RepID=UPI003870C89B
MFKFFSRVTSAAKIKKYMAHWIKTMSISFRDALSGQFIDQKSLDRVSVIIIGAAVTNADARSPRVMSCLVETAVSVGMTEEEIKHLPYSIAATLNGFNGITPLESRIGFLGQISPGYSFSVNDAGWFDTNIRIISEQLNSELRGAIKSLQG